MYTANLYLVFQRKDGQHGKRIVGSSELNAPNLNAAKAATSRIVKNHDVMSDWRGQDPTSRWSPVIEEENRKFVQKTFRTPPPNAADNLMFAIVDLVIG